jgi:crossover junction endodeoxyribonuclease RuvC
MGANGEGGALRILGVDPGTRIVGWGLIEIVTRCGSAVADGAGRAGSGSPGHPDSPGSSGPLGSTRTPIARRVANLQAVAGVGRRPQPRLLGVDAVRLAGRSAGERLGALAGLLERLIEEHRPDELALEEAFFGKSVQSALRIGEARGVVLASAYRSGLAVHQFPPARIKRCVTGSGAAGKEQVARFVAQALALRPPWPEADAADALAVALTRFEAWRQPALEPSAPPAPRERSGRTARAEGRGV